MDGSCVLDGWNWNLKVYNVYFKRIEREKEREMTCMIIVTILVVAIPRF